jgi:ubiquinone/menaquinone biosynthesis C-methylase UbiE
MDPKKGAARRWFDRRAGAYESGFTSRWRDPVQQASLDALELTPEDRLLDVGCGTGAASRAGGAIAKLVVGADLSSAMIRTAAELGQATDNVQFVMADAERLPFEDDAFTAVLCSNSFHHYPDPLSAVLEMTRVLAPAGRLVIGDACADNAMVRVADRFLRRFEPGHVRLYRSGELGGFLRSAGLSRVMRRSLSEGGMAIVRGFAV